MTAARKKSAPADPAGGRVAFEISAELRRRCEEAIAAVRAADEPREHLAELVEAVVELTDTGLDFYFLYPLERVGAGRVARGTAQVGVAAARRGLPTVVRRVVGSLSNGQVLELVDFIDEILVR